MYMYTNFMNMNIYNVGVHSYISCICILYKYVYMCTYTPVFVTVAISVDISKHLLTNSRYGHTASVYLQDAE